MTVDGGGNIGERGGSAAGGRLVGGLAVETGALTAVRQSLLFVLPVRAAASTCSGGGGVRVRRRDI